MAHSDQNGRNRLPILSGPRSRNRADSHSRAHSLVNFNLRNATRENEVGVPYADEWSAWDFRSHKSETAVRLDQVGKIQRMSSRAEGALMRDRTELLESALDSFPDGIAVLGMEWDVVFWNHAAEAILGFTGAELLARSVPDVLEPLVQGSAHHGVSQPCAEQQTARGTLVRIRHKLGHEMQAITRIADLRDGLGERIGTAIVFHPAGSLDALPHGVKGGNEEVCTSQVDLEDRLQIEFEDAARAGLPFGILWINVDQAPGLRKTHGSSACEAMLEKVQRALAQGLRPAEEVGRWGDDEFLIISHERTPEMLAAHAQVLAGLARTADFRWWGDRVSLTVSIGAAQAAETVDDEGLPQLLERARGALKTSIYAGGNCITAAPGRKECSPS
jgi:diguanylate cyclase (GGDEF)-like protein/PAS domain S-box-containing protein